MRCRRGRAGARQRRCSGRRRVASALRGGQHPDRADAHLRQKRQRLVLHHVGQRADEQKLPRLGRRQPGTMAARQASSPLGEGRLDARAGVVQHPHMRRVDLRQPLGGAGEVELDDLRRAGADEEQLLDVGAALSRRSTSRSSSSWASAMPARSPSSRIAVPKRGSAKIMTPAADCSRCAQVREPTTRKERVLHLAVQPDDAGQAAEHLALAAFLQDGGVLAASARDGGRTVHVVASASRRATRSFQRNCPALIT
jgi:hypothetical protein